MTIFISDSIPAQPAFIYAAYPPGTSGTISYPTPTSNPWDILEANEAAGVAFSTPGAGRNVRIQYPVATPLDCVALVGKGLSGVGISVYGGDDGSTPDLLLSEVICDNDRVFWSRHVPGSYLYYSYVFANTTDATVIKHIAGSLLTLLPWLNDGFCLDPVQAEGSDLVSYAGLYLGSVTQRVMKPFALDFGQVTDVENSVIAAMVDACVTTSQGLFFVPDTSQPTVHFGWIDKKYKFEPKMTQGMYTFPAIPLTARAI